MLGAIPPNKAFRKWFGNSVVTEWPGRGDTPKVVYHATRSPKDFAEFVTGTQFLDNDDNYDDREILISSSGDPGAELGPHFTESRELANKFAEGRAERWDQRRFVTGDHFEGRAYGRVIPVYLRIENPIYFDGDDALLRFIFTHGDSNELDDIIEAHLECEWDSDKELYDCGDDFRFKRDVYQEAFDRAAKIDNQNWGESSLVGTIAEELGWSIRNLLQSKRHDGIIYTNTVEGGGFSYVVFEPWQIKSAIGNRGTWSLHSPNIME